MENFHSPSIPSTTTITSTHRTNHSQFSISEPMSCFPSTTCSPSASRYYYYPAQYLAPNPGLQFQYAHNYYPYQQASPPMYPFLVQPNAVLCREQDSLDRLGRTMNALISKAARNERRMARQRSLSLSRNNANAAASSEGSSSTSRRNASFPWNATFQRNASFPRDGDDEQGFISSSSSGASADLQNTNKHLFTFCTPDNKKLRVLFRKELKNSDVGSLGRIVLPKKEAEENLPMLSHKEGILLMIREVYSDQEWGLKYKYWSNNKSRMYLFENTGDFVKHNRLEVGDCIYLYKDECKNLYISVEKVARPVHVAEPSYQQHPTNNNSSTSSETIITTGGPKVNNANDNTTTKDETPYTTDANNRNTNRKTYSNNSNAGEDISSFSPYTYVARDEENASFLELLMEQLKQDQEANRLVALCMDSASSSYRQREEGNNLTSHIETFTQPSTLARIRTSGAASSSSRSKAMMRMADVGGQFELEDCYEGLEMLPEVDRYKCCDYLFDCNGSMTDDGMT